PHFLHGRQQQADQDGYDGHDHQQLDEREGAATPLGWTHGGSPQVAHGQISSPSEKIAALPSDHTAREVRKHKRVNRGEPCGPARPASSVVGDCASGGGSIRNTAALTEASYRKRKKIALRLAWFCCELRYCGSGTGTDACRGAAAMTERSVFVA